MSETVPLEFVHVALQSRQRLTGLQWGYSGVNSFAHLNHIKCLTKPDTLFDIGILGVPFDTATTFRPGKCNNFFSFIM